VRVVQSDPADVRIHILLVHGHQTTAWIFDERALPVAPALEPDGIDHERIWLARGACGERQQQAGHGCRCDSHDPKTPMEAVGNGRAPGLLRLARIAGGSSLRCRTAAAASRAASRTQPEIYGAAPTRLPIALRAGYS